MNKIIQKHKWAVGLTVGFIITGISVMLLTNDRGVAVESGFIRFEIDRGPYRIVNHSPYNIELLRHTETYILNEQGWDRTSFCWGCVVLPDSAFKKNILPSGTEWSLPGTDDASEFCPADQACDRFAARRYIISEMPERTFIVYSNEERPGDPSEVKGFNLYISLSSSNPFQFTIRNDTDKSFWLCWTRRHKVGDISWGQDSRLEQKTKNGTWEMFQHSLDLCKLGTTSGIEIAPHETTEVDGLQAYPNTTQLPPGTYRWVIALVEKSDLDTLIFSQPFEVE